MIVFMQRVIVCERGGLLPIGGVIDFVGFDVPDSFLACDGQTHKRKLFDPEFVALMRECTSWWRWHLLRQFRVPVFPTHIGTDFGVATVPVDEKPKEPPSFEEFKRWCEGFENEPITLSEQQRRLYERYYEEPTIEQKDELERTLMIPRRDARYDKTKVTLWDRITGAF